MGMRMNGRINEQIIENHSAPRGKLKIRNKITKIICWHQKFYWPLCKLNKI